MGVSLRIVLFNGRNQKMVYMNAVKPNIKTFFLKSSATKDIEVSGRARLKFLNNEKKGRFVREAVKKVFF